MSNIRIVVCTLLVCVLSAGGAYAKSARKAADAGVIEGDGWQRHGPGLWIFSVDKDAAPDHMLKVEGTGQRIFRYELPRGAVSARVREVYVSYVLTGGARWMVTAEHDGMPAAKVLGEAKVDVKEEDLTILTKRPPLFRMHKLGRPLVSGPFWILHAAPADPSSKAAAVAAVQFVDTDRVWHRSEVGVAGSKTKHMPLVRVVLEDVRGAP